MGLKAGRSRLWRRAGVAALSLTLHLAAFAWLGVRAPQPKFATRYEPARLQVELTPRPQPAPAMPGPRTSAGAQPTTAAIPANTLPAADADGSIRSAPSGEPASLSGPEERMRAALRATVGCQSAQARLTPEEKERCEQAKANRMARAAPLPALTGMDPNIRAYYGAVAQAKAPGPPPVPGFSMEKGAEPVGMTIRNTPGSAPVFGCAIRWGNGKIETPNKPPHGFKFGPCVIGPPAGNLSPDVNVPLPSKVKP